MEITPPLIYAQYGRDAHWGHCDRQIMIVYLHYEIIQWEESEKPL